MKSLFVNRRMKILLNITLIAAMLFLAPNLWAKAARYCVWSQNLFETVDGGTTWINGQVWHQRGAVGEGEAVGEFNALFRYIQNTELNFIQDAGHTSGEVTFSDVRVYGLEEFEGSFEGRFNSFFIRGTEWAIVYSAHGSGDFEGMKLSLPCNGEWDTSGNPLETCEGFILDPHGTIPDEPCP